MTSGHLFLFGQALSSCSCLIKQPFSNYGQGSEQSKSVRFRLKKNLYFEHGGPLPLPELRTPPSAQPKVRWGCMASLAAKLDSGRGAVTT